MIKRLPKGYHDLNYKLYVAIINKIPSEKPEALDSVEWSRLVHLATLSILLGVSEAEIENLPAKEVMSLIQAISFLDEEPIIHKKKYPVKTMEEITFDEFAQYQKLRADQWNELGTILLIMLKGSTKESIDKMSIQEVLEVFFCVNKSVKKYIIRLKFLTTMKLMSQKIMSPFRLRKVSAKS